jgi:hypothetical protein
MPSSKLRVFLDLRVLEPLIENLIALLCEELDGDSVCVARAHAIQVAIRQFEGTNRTCLQLVRQSPVLKYYHSFADSLRQFDPLMHFLEGIKHINVFEGHYGDGPKNTTKFQNITKTGLLRDRFNTAQQLTLLDTWQLNSRVLHYRPSDVPTAVGTRVAVFIGRVRSLAQIYANRHADEMQECSICGKMTIRGAQQNLHSEEPSSTSNDFVVNSDEDDDDEFECNSAGTASFWKIAGPELATFLQTTHAPNTCCVACESAYSDEFRQAVPITAEFLDNWEARHVPAHCHGLSRVFTTAKVLQRRNAACVRALREARRQCKANTKASISINVIERIHELLMDMLNVDLAVVLAAAALAESPIMCTTRMLPACSAVWREDAARWKNVIQRVRAIYFDQSGHRQREKPLTFLDQPKWVRHVIDCAPELFPQRV